MKSLPVVALPEVGGDLRSGVLHYSSWRSDGEEHFLQMYEETVSWIGWNPETFPKKSGQVRRAILKHSYYIVYFIITTDRSSPANGGCAAVADYSTFGERNP